MKATDFILAIQIVSKSINAEIIVNYTASNAVVKNSETTPSLSIKNCTASVVDNLIKEGYSLNMKNGLLQVEKY